MNEPTPLLPFTSHPLGRRLRTEETEVMRLSAIRKNLLSNDVYAITDEVLLKLWWQKIPNVWRKGGLRGIGWTLSTECPNCGALTRLLRRPIGSANWGCRNCLRLIYPSQRRSGNGNRKGGAKPARSIAQRWSLKQQRIAGLLRLEQWPPAKLLWDTSDLSPHPRLSRRRTQTLLWKLLMLDKLRIESMYISKAYKALIPKCSLRSD